MNLPTYDTYIPADVRYDRGLSAGVKLFYGEVKSFCDLQGYCPLDKYYFAALYQVSTRTITNWVAQLEEAGHLHLRCDAAGEVCLHLD